MPNLLVKLPGYALLFALAFFAAEGAARAAQVAGASKPLSGVLSLVVVVGGLSAVLPLYNRLFLPVINRLLGAGRHRQPRG